MVVKTGSLEGYLQDASGYRGEASQVFLPADQRELSEVARRATAEQVTITVAGAGTGLTGARVPHGGYVVSLERFRKLEIERGRARCGAGVVLQDLHEAAAKTHQFFGPNPTESTASAGGIVSTNAGGARSFHYGAVRRHVLALDVTFADGSNRRFARGDKVDFATEPVRLPPTTKNSAGYYLQPNLEWVDLLAGSEGTLAIVTEIEFALLPLPAAILSGVIFFPSDENALQAAADWRPVPELRLLEFMDDRALRMLEPLYPDIPKQAGAALLVEQNLKSEDEPEVDEWLLRLKKQDAFAESSWFGFRPADHERFRDLRHALPAMVTDMARRNGFSKFGTDFAVPLPRNDELHAYYKRRCSDVLPRQFTIFGHIGDANNHVNLLPETPEQAQAGAELIDEFAAVVVKMDGTVAAEHGIGKIKTDLLPLMYDPSDMAAMRAVKQTLDPKGMLGPGTIFGN
ncbi:MAG TPA: FAD-binding oxidoreductase [Bryobacteraceae bacterium]|jgi:FAD/FMN-containing dehydrogenase|nr:FAD-binding oxidoreductase [Bryobacteraceae bacterium]